MFEDFYTDDDYRESEESFDQPIGEYVAEVREYPKWVLSRRGVPELHVKAVILKTISGEPAEGRTLVPRFPLLQDNWAKAFLRRLCETAGLGSYQGLLPTYTKGPAPSSFVALLEREGAVYADQFPVPLQVQVRVTAKDTSYTDQATGDVREIRYYRYVVKAPSGVGQPGTAVVTG